MKFKNFFISTIFIIPFLSVNLISCSNNSIENNNNDIPQKPKPPLGWTYKTNTKASDVNQFDIEHNKRFHFNYPIYKDNLVSMKADGAPIHNVPGPGIIGGKESLENVLTSEKHVQLAKQVYSIGFHNGSEKIGTAWILDYKLTNDNSYPITWYFGTNAHVLDDLKVKNDKLYPEKFGEWNDDKNIFRTINTEAISLWYLNNPIKDKVYKDNYSNIDWSETRINFYNSTPPPGEIINGAFWKGYYLENPPIKTIFVGNDFLKTSPKDSAINSYSLKEEYADFGVFELTFQNEEQARKTTNDYANWDEEFKFKYHKEDLLKNPLLETEKVYTVGFPQNGSTGGVPYRVISVNENIHDYNNKTYKGNGLGTSPHYNSWTGKPGKYDGHIAMPWFGYTYEYVDNTDNGDDPVRKENFSTHGLIYSTNNGCMRPGSSGALVVDDNGYALGVHFSSDYNAASGSA